MNGVGRQCANAVWSDLDSEDGSILPPHRDGVNELLHSIQYMGRCSFYGFMPQPIPQLSVSPPRCLLFFWSCHVRKILTP
jgi:hypothetical protein